MKLRSRLSLALAIGIVTLIAASCGNDPVSATGPTVNIELNKFGFQYSDLTDLTETFNYFWDNNGTSARIEYALTVTDGTVHLKLQDALGNEVYDDELESGTILSTSAGEPGQWTVRVMLSNYTGSISLNLDKL